eukprot:13626668-Alexandrium_andersonii.AAC.1
MRHALVAKRVRDARVQPQPCWLHKGSGLASAHKIAVGTCAQPRFLGSKACTRLAGRVYARR